MGDSLGLALKCFSFHLTPKLSGTIKSLCVHYVRVTVYSDITFPVLSYCMPFFIYLFSFSPFLSIPFCFVPLSSMLLHSNPLKQPVFPWHPADFMTDSMVTTISKTHYLKKVKNPKVWVRRRGGCEDPGQLQ